MKQSELIDLLTIFENINPVNKEDYFLECVRNRLNKHLETYVGELSDLERFVKYYKYGVNEIIKKL